VRRPFPRAAAGRTEDAVEIEPFRIAVDDAVLVDLDERLARTRFPDEIPGSGWGYGTELASLRRLVDYWRNDFDWRREEARLNRFPQYRARVGGLSIHFIHQRGKGPRPFPLVLTHGWPDSINGFARIIGPLTDPASHGGDPADAFDVICPSMPGYGFSEHPREPGMDSERIAALWAELMVGLGYERFGAQGGDWGAMVSTYLGYRHARHVAGIHLNMVVAVPPDPSDPIAGLTQDEVVRLMRARDFLRDETGYYRIQGTKPQTLAYALNDSPAGLAAWIVEKFRAWSDCGGDVETRFSKDDLLTNIMLYWVPETANSSSRLYCETMRAGKFPPTDFRVEAPTGCAIFPQEIIRPPRAWVERLYNVTRWTEMPRGGHFAAMEEPALLVDDIRTFFRTVR
jgi:pimeloyl-ACP methyl ester carboxylesterase